MFNRFQGISSTWNAIKISLIKVFVSFKLLNDVADFHSTTFETINENCVNGKFSQTYSNQLNII